MFKVYLCLKRMEIYKSNELNQKSIIDLKVNQNEELKLEKLKDFYIAVLSVPMYVIIINMIMLV